MKIRDHCAKSLTSHDVLDVTDAEVVDPDAEPGSYLFDIQGRDFICTVHVSRNLVVMIEDREGVAPSEVIDCVAEANSR